MARLELTEVPGIGPVTAERMRAIGITDVAALATHSVDDIAALPGFHRGRAANVQAAARQLLGEVADTAEPVAKAVSPAKKAKAVKAPDAKKKGKNKKDDGKDAKKKKKPKRGPKKSKASKKKSKKDDGKGKKKKKK
jgi:nucleotidyltransferase/DNA polymerase involved in DNA repair